jgi:hypothetical protein
MRRERREQPKFEKELKGLKRLQQQEEEIGNRE